MSSSLLGCIKCNHKGIVKDDFYNKEQVCRCKRCRATFTKNSGSPYAWHRFPKGTIAFAVMLYMNGLPGQAVSDILRKRCCVEVSAWTICKWVRKFGSLDEMRRRCA